LLRLYRRNLLWRKFLRTRFLLQEVTPARTINHPPAAVLATNPLEMAGSVASLDQSISTASTTEKTKMIMVTPSGLSQPGRLSSF